MPPKHKAPRGHAAVKPKKAAAAGEGASGTTTPLEGEVDDYPEDEAPKVVTAAEVSDRNCTGECAMAPGAKDIKFVNFSLSFHGERLIEEADLELNFGRRYGFIGRNGSGKTTFLRSLANRDLAIPPHIDMYLHEKETPPTDMTAHETVVKVAMDEVKALEAKEERILTTEGPDSLALMAIYERLGELDPDTADKRAGEILFHLGFTGKMAKKATKDMSGGWRMRVALAIALFIRPTLLLMDEPTNHLDLGTCVWLERYLATYDKILVIVSHSQDFLNTVCTNIMHLTMRKKLMYYAGNYATYVKTRAENEVQQMKQYEKQQEEIKHIKQFISSCGTYSNLVRQAKSRQKLLDKMEADGLIQPVDQEHQISLMFPSCDKLASPVLALKKVGFSYDGNMANALYQDLEFGLDLDSRVVLVGPNGAGKSTLLKLFMGELRPTVGEIQKHGHLRVGRYTQHSDEILKGEMCPIDWIRQEFPDPSIELTEWRKRLGRFGVSGTRQTKPIDTMSDGQKTQLIFCWLAQKAPHMLLFDEPTNALDMESIDALALAINAFEGGMVLVSHDFRLLQQCAKEIIVCDNHSVTKWDGDIVSYKKHLQSMIDKGLL